MLTVNLNETKFNEEHKHSKISTGYSSFIGNENQDKEDSKVDSKQSTKTLKCPESPSKQSKLSKKISSSLIGYSLENTFDSIKVI